MYILFAGNQYYSCDDIASASIKLITNNLAEIFNAITYTEVDELGYEVKGFTITGSVNELNNGLYDWLEVFNLDTKTIIFKIDNTDNLIKFNSSLELLEQFKNYVYKIS